MTKKIDRTATRAEMAHRTDRRRRASFRNYKRQRNFWILLLVLDTPLLILSLLGLLDISVGSDVSDFVKVPTILFFLLVFCHMAAAAFLLITKYRALNAAVSWIIFAVNFFIVSISVGNLILTGTIVAFLNLMGEGSVLLIEKATTVRIFSFNYADPDAQFTAMTSITGTVLFILALLFVLLPLRSAVACLDSGMGEYTEFMDEEELE